jgi:hypothetical protein
MATGDNAVLTRASVSFHTNDEDKDDDSRVEVTVRLMDQTVVASIADEFEHFDDHSNAGPFDLLITPGAKRSRAAQAARGPSAQPARQRPAAGGAGWHGPAPWALHQARTRWARHRRPGERVDRHGRPQCP